MPSVHFGVTSDPSVSGEYVVFECALWDEVVASPADAEALAMDLLSCASRARANRQATEMVAEMAEDSEGVIESQPAD